MDGVEMGIVVVGGVVSIASIVFVAYLGISERRHNQREFERHQEFIQKGKTQ